MKFNLEGKIPSGSGRIVLLILLALLGYEGGVLLGLV